MLPTDADWFSNDGNEPITHDWTNALERSVDQVKASGNDGTFPAPAGTALPLGGGKLVVLFNSAGIADGNTWTADTSIDWRNRYVRILEIGLCNSANRLPGEATYDGTGTHGFDVDETGMAIWTGAGTADPGVGAATGPYCEIVAGDVYLYSAADGKLTVSYHAGGAGTYRVFAVLLVTDQFPTRLP